MTPADALPTLDDWRDWFDAMARFKHAAPWCTIEDHQLFAVCAPDDPSHTVFCHVLGIDGVRCGLSIFMGAHGFYTFCSIYGGTFDFSTFDCISMTYTPRNALIELAPYVNDAAAALGVTFDTGSEWPSVLRYVPYLVDHQPSAQDLHLAVYCIEHVIDVATRVHTGTLSLPSWRDKRILTRVPARADATLHWTDEVRPISAPPPSRRLAPVPPPPLFLDQVRATCTQSPATWDYDCRVFAARIKRQPSYPDLLLCINAGNRHVYGPRIFEHTDDWRTVPQEFMQLLLAAGEYPTVLAVRTPALADVLQPSADALGIRIRSVDHLPRFDAMYVHLLKSLHESQRR